MKLLMITMVLMMMKLFANQSSTAIGSGVDDGEVVGKPEKHVPGGHLGGGGRSGKRVLSISAREGAPRASQDVLLVVEREAEIELFIGKDAFRRCAHWKRIVGPRV